ncbi:Rnd [Desulfamplus magnetovallimortis]|uniref:Rnd n=1 Tax=Desulfamplus magnetovallimortis TaxID=1246637 RepID=A0A1W1HDD1_9BACT|nr:ribonuclease D [Desulfamplus magnetovallimortis]SLM30446.1 Rnd [Desulfamplus magnetovallimortis]
MIEHTLINSDEDLKQQCEYIETHSRIAMDIEADSMHHFKEQVCLIQMADPEKNYLIDPLTIQDFSALKPLCENPAITKVFHGADFDIRSLDRDFNIRINNLFDTEIACRFLGIQRRSLAALLKKHFNLCLDKRFQRTDWSRRPLSDEMIAYSINDVAHLLELADILKKKLADSGRLSWAVEEFELQSEVRYDKTEDMPLFLKFKGAGKMGRENLAVLESLLQMRAAIAEKKNLPLFKIMGTETISQLTLKHPKTMQQLKDSRILSPKQINMYGELCVEAIVKGMAVPQNQLPSYPRKKSPEIKPEIPERIKALKHLRNEASQRTGIEPGFLMNNATITAIATVSPSTEEELKNINGTRNWQVNLLGKNIISVLNICS